LRINPELIGIVTRAMNIITTKISTKTLYLPVSLTTLSTITKPRNVPMIDAAPKQIAYSKRSALLIMKRMEEAPVEKITRYILVAEEIEGIMSMLTSSAFIIMPPLVPRLDPQIPIKAAEMQSFSVFLGVNWISFSWNE